MKVAYLSGPASSLPPCFCCAPSPGSQNHADHLHVDTLLLGTRCSEWAEQCRQEEPSYQLRLPCFQSWTEATSKDHPIRPQALAAAAQNSTVAPYQCLLVLPRDPKPTSVSRKAIPGYLCGFSIVEMI